MYRFPMTLNGDVSRVRACGQMACSCGAACDVLGIVNVPDFVHGDVANGLIIFGEVEDPLLLIGGAQLRIHGD